MPSKPQASANGVLARTVLAGTLALPLLAAIPGNGAAAVPQECGRFDFPPTDVGVTSHKIHDPPVDLNRSVEQLTGTGQHGDGEVHGLTQARSAYELSVEVQAYKLPQGGVCASPTRLQAELTEEELQIYVASRYEPGSCGYRRVLEHEHRHVAINHDMIDRAAQSIKSALQDAVSGGLVLHTETADAAVQELSDDLGARVQEAFTQAKEQAQQRHRAFDQEERGQGYFAGGPC